MVYETEFYHHGIKGMKWGVRRYQNPDGTLTAKGKKRLAKNEAYRDKLVNKAKKKADSRHRDANEALDDVKDLKKNGTNSRAYRKWQSEQEEERRSKYENDERNTIIGEDGTKYHKSYSTSGTRIMDTVFDTINSKQQIANLIDERNTDARRYREAAKQWTKKQESLMTMEVTALNKSDIRRTYWH